MRKTLLCARSQRWSLPSSPACRWRAGRNARPSTRFVITRSRYYGLALEETILLPRLGCRRARLLHFLLQLLLLLLMFLLQLLRLLLVLLLHLLLSLLIGVLFRQLLVFLLLLLLQFLSFLILLRDHFLLLLLVLLVPLRVACIRSGWPFHGWQVVRMNRRAGSRNIVLLPDVPGFHRD